VRTDNHHAFAEEHDDEPKPATMRGSCCGQSCGCSGIIASLTAWAAIGALVYVLYRIAGTVAGIW
jgi:hypothetical protein